MVRYPYADRASLEDMRNHAREAVVLLRGTILNELANNRVLELALRKLVEIVGEAANRVSISTRKRYTEIPWPQTVGLRSRLVPKCEELSLERLLDTINDDLPPLTEKLDLILIDEP